MAVGHPCGGWTAQLSDLNVRYYSKPKICRQVLANHTPSPLARFPNLATLESVNLIVGFTITDRDGK